MNFEATFLPSASGEVLGTMQDRSASGLAARSAIEAVLNSGALDVDRLVHVHATTSERMVAILVRVVEHPEDAR